MAGGLTLKQEAARSQGCTKNHSETFRLSCYQKNPHPDSANIASLAEITTPCSRKSQ